MLCKMMRYRDRTPGGTISDATQTRTHGGVADLADQVKEQLVAAGLSGKCVVLPLNNDIGSLAALIAALDMRLACALLPGAIDVDAACPDFADTVVRVTVAPDSDTPEVEITKIAGRTAHDVEQARVYLRTSGSTGKPKWCVHHADLLVATSESCIDRLEIAEDDRVMIPVPINHMYGLGAGLLPSILGGAAIHLVSRGNPLDVFQAERDFEPNMAFMVPSQCRSLMAMRRKPRAYRQIVVAGDRLSAEEAAKFEGLHGPVLNLYGCTELGAIAAARPSMDAETRHEFTGPLIDGVRYCAPEKGTAEEPTPLAFKATGNFIGYADETGAPTDVAPQCYATGDVGYISEDGYVRVMGRADHAIKRDGLFVHLSEVEGCLAGIDAVAEAVVVSAGETRRGVGITAFCVIAKSATLSEDDIRAHCINALPSRAVPDVIKVVETLPRLDNGKSDRMALAAQAAELAAL